MKTNLYDICVALEQIRDECTDLFTCTTKTEVFNATQIRLPNVIINVNLLLGIVAKLKSTTVSTTKPRSKRIVFHKATLVNPKGLYKLYQFPNGNPFDLCSDGLKLIFGRVPKTIYLYQETQQ